MTTTVFYVMLAIGLGIVLLVVFYVATFTRDYGMKRWIANAEAEADAEQLRGTSVVPTEPPKGQDVSLWADLTDET